MFRLLNESKIIEREIPSAAKYASKIIEFVVLLPLGVGDRVILNKFLRESSNDLIGTKYCRNRFNLAEEAIVRYLRYFYDCRDVQRIADVVKYNPDYELSKQLGGIMKNYD